MSPPTCHVVSHVHWDREWYRPFEGYRARLLELVERVCDDLDSGARTGFHLDGQTVTLQDVGALRPDLAERLRGHAAAGTLTIGPWHVLADNQLVSAENLVRNLLLARRLCGQALSPIGYSPDAFGHPADLPRVLAGFGMDTALVWRGAPPEHARFRWRSADGSEVFAVNQAYHQAEVLWDADAAPAALAGFLDRERERLPGGPWLLLNGGDHLVPARPAERAAALAGAAATARESTLRDFFDDARAAARTGAALPVVDGELRFLGDRLTFLLPGTLSARGYVKALNDRAQVLLERFVEPALAAGAGQGRALTNGRESLDHAWELLVQNAPHDSICGCSVDEVHRETTVRAERVLELGEQVLRRAALADGLDTRGAGPPATEAVDVLVRSADGDVASGPVVVEVTTAADRHVTALLDPDGTQVPVEVEHLGPAQWFEADLDVLPDTARGWRHRLAFVAADVPALGWAVYRAVLGAEPTQAPVTEPATSVTVDGTTLAVAGDASVTVTTPGGAVHPGLGRLVDGGDRGDSYSWDPPAQDALVVPRVEGVVAHTSAVRSRLAVRASLPLPRALAQGRDARSTATLDVPVDLVVERWAGDPVVRWSIEVDNTAEDHRLRWHAPVAGAPAVWRADTHWSVQERPFAPVVGRLPTEPGLEAAIGTSPAHTFATAGEGDGRVAVLLDALPEVQGLASDGASELVVTLLRAVGWLSRFDLRTRTTGAGPAFEVPEAQCRGRHRMRLGVLLGADAEDDLALAQAAARHHVPLRAMQLRALAPARRSEPGASPRVRGAVVSAVKPAEAGSGAVLRVANPTGTARTARVHLPRWAAAHREVRLDETPVTEAAAEPVGAAGVLTLELAPWAVRSLHLVPGAPGRG